jgi:hypothetical protein
MEKLREFSAYRKANRIQPWRIGDVMEEAIETYMAKAENQMPKQFYCYEYVVKGQTVYVGKGKGRRAAEHICRSDLHDVDELDIRITKHSSDYEARIDEAERIERIGLHNLLNKVQPSVGKK